MSQPAASEQLHLIATRLRAQGEGAMLRGMAKTIRGTAQPLVRSAEQSAREHLPRSGGLNELVAGRHTTVSVLTSARTAGVRLKRARKDAASRQTNRGYIYHHTWGHDPWKKLELPEASGWWDKPMQAGSPVVTRAIVAEMNRVAREIQA